MKQRIIAIIAALLLTACAGKRYDSATEINSKTTIKQDSSAPISVEVPVAVTPYGVQTLKQSVGDAAHTSTGRSMNGRKLVEVRFCHRDGNDSILEVVDSGERFRLKGKWGESGEVFKLER